MATETFDLEEALRELRFIAESDPSTDQYRKIHAGYHRDGILVLCRDAGCEVVAEVSNGGNGRNRVRVDGIDVTPILESPDARKLLGERLTLNQLITLTAVMDAIVDELRYAPLGLGG